MNCKYKTDSEALCGHDEWEIERTNAKLRHFRGIAASVMNDALKVWQQIWECCQDSRTCYEILDGIDEPGDQIPSCGWPELRERLFLLKHYIEYAQKLCEGSIDKIDKISKDGREV